VRPLPLAPSLWSTTHVCAPPLRSAKLSHLPTHVHSRRSVALSSRHLPLSLFAQARVASTQYTVIKGGHLYISSALTPCHPPISRHRRTASVFRHSIGAKPSHSTSLPVHRSRSFFEFRSYFPNQEGDTFTAVELRRRRSRR
jgi:hypothetical protein